MLLSDEEIRALIESGALADAREENVRQVSYDLTTRGFHTSSGPASSCALSPGDSVFVSSEERVELPADLAARVLLRNSRIRQGLALDAPLYFPGHKTRLFFRVTNVSSDVIELAAGAGIAQLVFERVERPVSAPYDGAFSDEFDYRGMGDYESAYGGEMRRIEKKAREIEGVEKRMYGNVLALMSVVAAIFSLVNVNICGAMASASAAQVIVMSLATIGSFSLLVALIMVVVRPKGRYALVAPWALAVVAFAAAVVVAAVFL